MKAIHSRALRSSAEFTMHAVVACFVAGCDLANAQGPILPQELVAPKIEISGNNVHFTVQPSVNGCKYQLQSSETLATGAWQNVGGMVTGDGNNLVISTPHVAGNLRLFYRLAIDEPTSVPDEFALIPAGWFQMGDQSNLLVGWSDERPVHSVYVSPFYMGRYEVTKGLWDDVRAWGLNNGYTDLPVGGGKAANHPVHSITWHDMVKWCNARSEKENLVPCYTVGGLTYKTGWTDPVCELYLGIADRSAWSSYRPLQATFFEKPNLRNDATESVCSARTRR